ncbi:hypothetical protein FQZ97_572670 [compost metagenome]
MSKPDPVQDARIVSTEIKEWEIHLNTVTGMLGFTFGIAALGTPLPQLWAFISLVFLLVFHYSATRNKMTKLRMLDRKKDRTEYEDFLREHIRSNHIKIYKYPAFLCGATLLLFLVFAPNLMPFSGNEKFLDALYGDKPYARAGEVAVDLLNSFYK